MIRPYVVISAAVAVLTSALTSCGDSEGDKADLTVFAASSLTEAFGELEDRFEDAHPDVDVVLSLDSSGTLAEQVVAGAPADVIATADDVSMNIVTEADMLTAERVNFVTNTLIVVTPPDNPAHVAGVDDLDGTDFVVCDPSVPCGAAAATILDQASITTEPRSLEENVKAVLSKVSLGEADAGIVYVSDAIAAGDDVQAFDIPSELNVTNPYYIGVVKGSDQNGLAEEWLALVQSDEGARALEDAGFNAL